MLVGLDAQGVPSYVFYGQQGADRQLLPPHLLSVPRGAPAYHFGSYSMAVEPTATTLRELVQREGARSVISYDPNVRLRVEPDAERWRGILAWMMPRAHLLKVSEEDIGLLYPGMSVEDFAARARDTGSRLVVVTRGALGSKGFSERATVEVPAAASKVVDTVGAGDTFQAALLAWLSETGRLAPTAVGSLDAAALGAALDFASRAAAITCSRRGADMPRRTELDAPIA
jgi:fructokinase